MFVFQNPRAILCSPAMLEAVMISVEQKLGIPRQSAMFRYVVHALASVGEKYFEAKFDIFRSFGWSESDIISLARNVPFCFALSEVNIRNKLDFFMEKLGFEPQYLVATRLLKLSMGKRLFPRNAVLQILKEKQLIRTKFSYHVAMLLKESEFLRKYVLPYKDEAPDLREVDVSYLDSCMNVADYGKVLIQLPTYYGLALLSMQKNMEDVFTTSFDFDVRLKLVFHVKYSSIKD
ncbi:hypothetical protein Nepgr_003222 [Nepenthes gracilis]|uniref:Uncharacterized protein n=1 Tax=Nepenthes gracilis TaxID=150966 RepID=A0AAD3RZ53_NEPGR|nr:hypothetical protein Nepgr_003222 [Nepenthes gracilis]